jgi:fumarate reductase flavoprotein subunit
MRIKLKFQPGLALLLCGCLASAALRAEGPKFTQETDVVVVGAGAAGLSATVTLAEAGAKVVLLEQNPFPGGTGNVAEGIMGINSRLQRNHYYGAPMIDLEQVFQHEMTYNHWKGNASLMRAFLAQSGRTVDWLQDEGVQFEEVAQTTFDGIRTWHVIHGHGAGAIKVLFGKAKQNPNVTVFMETPATGLITDGRNQVIGASAQGKNGPMRIKAKAVVLATGGFADNPEMVKQFVGNTFSGSVANFHKVGFGIKMALGVGARTEGMGTLMNSAVYDKKKSGKLGPPNPVDLEFDALGQQPMNIMVNNHGERFCDELIANNFVLQANAIERQPANSCWIIFSEDLRKHYVQDGIDAGMGVIVPIGTPLKKLDGAMEGYLAAGDRNIYSADSVEALAAKIKVPAEALKRTLEAYNHDCQVNRDSGFGKNPYFMKQITGKLYAMHEVTSYLITVGGVVVNNQMQPLDKDDHPIPGLYVVGCDVGGLYGDSYGLDSPGTSFGFAFTSPRMAAPSILATLNQK